jgi:hypothetical protein
MECIPQTAVIKHMSGKKTYWEIWKKTTMGKQLLCLKFDSTQAQGKEGEEEEEEEEEKEEEQEGEGEDFFPRNRNIFFQTFSVRSLVYLLSMRQM